MRKERIKTKLNNYDEKIDTLIRSALQEKSGDYKVSDEVKKRIDQRLKESKKKNMSEKLNKKTGVCILAGISLLAIIIVISVIATGKKVAQSGEVFNPTFKDEDGKLYVAALFKEMTESTVTVDVIEFITDADVERITELNLTENEMPDGYYIYNQDTETVTWNLDSQTVYMFIDWNGDFTGSEYPEEYTTTDLQEFRKYIETYQDAAPGMPFFFQIENGMVRLILEKQIA